MHQIEGVRILLLLLHEDTRMPIIIRLERSLDEMNANVVYFSHENRAQSDQISQSWGVRAESCRITTLHTVVGILSCRHPKRFASLFNDDWTHALGPFPVELGRLSRLVDLHVVKGCPSYSLPLYRAFTRWVLCDCSAPDLMRTCCSPKSRPSQGAADTSIAKFWVILYTITVGVHGEVQHNSWPGPGRLDLTVRSPTLSPSPTIFAIYILPL